MPLSPIPEILEELRAGRIIILVDDEDRENEGDFVCAAEKVTPDIINFMIRVGGGYLCVPLTESDCDRLALVPQSAANTSAFGTPLTITVDGHPRHGVGTGVSTRDRAATIRLLIDPATTAADFVRPGHINPLRSRDGGVLVRTGQTEGSVDLARLAGLHPSAVLIEVVRDDGEMARMPDLESICGTYAMKMCSIEQIIEYRLAREALVQRLEPRDGVIVETACGPFNLFAFQSAIDPLPHLALTLGGIGGFDSLGRVRTTDDPVLVRVHRRDLLGDVFGEVTQPTGSQLHGALRMIQEAGRGALVYLQPEAWGSSLRERLMGSLVDPPRREPAGLSGFGGTVATPGPRPADARELGIGSQILRDLGIRRMKLLTNHPKSHPGLHGFGLEVVEQVPIPAAGADSRPRMVRPVSGLSCE
jgi:3,4-dihydroxy 2-butanone 4-phosphate synthase/GTP cyclohydrolase II